MKHSLKNLLAILLGLNLLNPILEARDAGTIVTQNFQDVELLSSYAFQYIHPSELLVVFDIDNTLLKFDNDFGSEHWFLWQKELIEKNISNEFQVTNSMDHLLMIQSWIYHYQPMYPVTSNEISWINALRTQGASVIALTSRTLINHDSTMREIMNNRIPMSTALELGLTGEGEIYWPYNLQHPEDSGLTVEDLQRFKLVDPKPVQFDRGVLLTQGLHKGAMLKTLTHRMQKKFKAIIFIDDRRSHIDAMKDMSSTIDEEVFTIHFNLSETWTKPFFQNSKDQVHRQWCEFSDWLNKNIYVDPNSRIYHSCKKI